jgi:hypothetical protein
MGCGTSRFGCQRVRRWLRRHDILRFQGFLGGDGLLQLLYPFALCTFRRGGTPRILSGGCLGPFEELRERQAGT